MPLIMAQSGVEQSIKQIHGQENTKHFLEGLGFVVGGNVTIVSQNGRKRNC